MQGVSGLWGGGQGLSRLPHTTDTGVSVSPEEKELGKVVTKLSTGNPDFGSCFLPPREGLGIQGFGGASQQAPKARPGGMSFWLSQVAVPRVGKASKKGSLLFSRLKGPSSLRGGCFPSEPQ